MSRRDFLASSSVAAAAMPAVATPAAVAAMPDQRFTSTYKRIRADGVEVFYREAGAGDAPVLLLLHGFPNSSVMFQELMPRLADKYRLIAPDIPSFGFTVVPEERHYTYSFESFAKTLGAFTDALGLKRYGMYVFDFGAPIGFRHALDHPERITGIISQNGNAYEEGLGEAFWAPVRAAWKDPSPARLAALRGRISFQGIKDLYLTGVPNPNAVAPENYWLDFALVSRPGITDIQVHLKVDYASNIELYPKFQEFFRKAQVPTLAVWGKNDLAFIPPGAEAFRRDNPQAVVQLLNTGHFALTTHVDDITMAIREMHLAT
jgi:pimeloyl-ACP methyl ester carboxylesterase